jgi:hypothetical protein
MPDLPADLNTCSTTESIAALLYLGWTHEEIAAATGVSKGTVQNRRDELEAGKLDTPPEAFNLVRSREHEVHRIVRDTGGGINTHGTQVADRVEAIAELDALDIGLDGDITYEELVAFATLVAGQMNDFEAPEVIKRLAAVVEKFESQSNSPGVVPNLPKPGRTKSNNPQDQTEVFGSFKGGKPDTETPAADHTSENALDITRTSGESDPTSKVLNLDNSDELSEEDIMEDTEHPLDYYKRDPER